MTNRRLRFSKTVGPDTRSEKITPNLTEADAPIFNQAIVAERSRDKNKQGSPNRIIRAELKGDATGAMICATSETIFKSVQI